VRCTTGLRTCELCQFLPLTAHLHVVVCPVRAVGWIAANSAAARTVQNEVFRTWVPFHVEYPTVRVCYKPLEKAIIVVCEAQHLVMMASPEHPVTLRSAATCLGTDRCPWSVGTARSATWSDSRSPADEPCMVGDDYSARFQRAACGSDMESFVLLLLRTSASSLSPSASHNAVVPRLTPLLRLVMAGQDAGPPGAQGAAEAGDLADHARTGKSLHTMCKAPQNCSSTEPSRLTRQGSQAIPPAMCCSRAAQSHGSATACSAGHRNC
jgi:hypothetical protein